LSSRAGHVGLTGEVDNVCHADMALVHESELGAVVMQDIS